MIDYPLDPLECACCEGTGIRLTPAVWDGEVDADETHHRGPHAFSEICECEGTGRVRCTHCGEEAITKDLVNEAAYCAECLAAARKRTRIPSIRLARRPSPQRLALGASPAPFRRRRGRQRRC